MDLMMILIWIESHVIPALIKKMITAKLTGKTMVKVWGTGSVSREFLYSEDAADAIILASALYDKL